MAADVSIPLNYFAVLNLVHKLIPKGIIAVYIIINELLVTGVFSFVCRQHHCK